MRLDTRITGVRVVLEQVARRWMTAPGAHPADPTMTLDLKTFINHDPTESELRRLPQQLEYQAARVDFVKRCRAVVNFVSGTLSVHGQVTSSVRLLSAHRDDSGGAHDRRIWCCAMTTLDELLEVRTEGEAFAYISGDLAHKNLAPFRGWSRNSAQYALDRPVRAREALAFTLHRSMVARACARNLVMQIQDTATRDAWLDVIALGFYDLSRFPARARSMPSGGRRAQRRALLTSCRELASSRRPAVCEFRNTGRLASDPEADPATIRRTLALRWSWRWRRSSQGRRQHRRQSNADARSGHRGCNGDEPTVLRWHHAPLYRSRCGDIREPERSVLAALGPDRRCAASRHARRVGARGLHVGQ